MSKAQKWKQVAKEGFTNVKLKKTKNKDIKKYNTLWKKYNHKNN